MARDEETNARWADLKTGDIVEIFEDPITRNKLEGRAKLVKFEGRDGQEDAEFHFEYWKVMFTSEPGSKYDRHIRVDHQPQGN